MAGTRNSGLVAKSTIRTLAADPVVAMFESDLHAARGAMLGFHQMEPPFGEFLREIGFDVSIDDDPAQLSGLLCKLAEPDLSGWILQNLAKMDREGYLAKQCPLLSLPAP